MKNEKYVIGLDYGSLSGRALLINAATGEEAAQSVLDYPHAIMYDTLPDGTPLPPDAAVQHPEDYLLVLKTVIRDVIRQAKIAPEQVIGIGIDFTTATILPVASDLQPLSRDPRFANHPKAYVTMWKDHSGAEQAARVEQVALERNEAFFARYGKKCSAESGIAKLLCICQTDPELYAAADQIVEAGDWLVQLLTGTRKRSYNIVCKEYWCRDLGGYPSEDFMAALDPGFRNVVRDKLGGEESVCRDLCFGEVTEEAAKLCGLAPGTAVAVPFADATVSIFTSGMTRPGKMLMIVGTSLCHFSLSEECKDVPGMFVITADGVFDGLTLYEAGQSSCGDHLAWYIDNCVPADYALQAKERGMGIHAFLREKASRLHPGQSGLLCLDWFNGNRSILNRADLSALILGMTLQTKPEEIYRALLEATVFGTRRIMDAMIDGGLTINEIIACGGIAKKDPLMMQLFADITGRPVVVCASAQAPARSDAILALAAAGADRGGCDSLREACARFAQAPDRRYEPDLQAKKTYDLIYAEYLRLHDLFGQEDDLMRRLKEISMGEKYRG